MLVVIQTIVMIMILILVLFIGYMQSIIDKQYNDIKRLKKEKKRIYKKYYDMF